MMKALRKSVSGFAAKLLLATVIGAFAVTGFSSFFTGGAPTTVATAGSTQVSIDDYRLAYQQAESTLARRMQRRPTRQEAESYGIDRQVLSQLVTGALLDEQGRRIGLGLSEDRLLRLIAEDPSFKDASGNFSRVGFKQLLANIGLTEKIFVENRQQVAVRNQIVEAVTEGAQMPKVLQTALGIYDGERRTVDYLSLSPVASETIAIPSDEALKTFFDARKGQYASPEYRSVAYAVLTPEAIMDPGAVTDAAIASEYEKNVQRYTAAEKRQIRQIVYPSPESAKAARESLASGKIFEQLIIQSGRTATDADLGNLSKAEIPDPAIADAAFKLKAGEVSDVVQGMFGPVLIEVSAIQPETRQPLDAVKDEIRKILALDAATNTVQQSYDAYEDARAGGSTIDEAAVRAGLTVKTIAAIDRNGLAADGTKISDLPSQGDLLSQAFETEPGTETLPINIGRNGYLFFDVKSVTPARDRTLEEVKDKVVADWKTEEAHRLLAAKIEALKKRVEAGETLDAISAETAAPKSTANSITRQSGSGDLGQGATAAAFSGPVNFVSTAPAADGQAQILLKVVDVSQPADPGAEVPAKQSQQLSETLRDDLLQSYVAQLRRDFPTAVNPRAVEQAKAMVR